MSPDARRVGWGVRRSPLRSPQSAPEPDKNGSQCDTYLIVYQLAAIPGPDKDETGARVREAHNAANVNATLQTEIELLLLESRETLILYKLAIY